MDYVGEKRKPYFFTVRGAFTLLALVLSAGMIWLSSSVMNVALPEIEYDLNATLNELQWAVNVFTLCGGLIIVSGRLADVFGRKKLLMIGAVVFIAGGTAGGFADNISTLIAARAIQGIGGAMILPASLALVEVNFHPPHRTIAIGLWIGLAWFAMAIGPAVGGAMVAIASWRWVMWVMVPIALVVLVLVGSLINESKNRYHSSKVDYWGAVVVMAGMFGITYAAIESGITGWLSPLTMGMLVGGVVLTALFVWIEKHVEVPVLGIGLLKDRTFNGANLVNVISNITFASVLFFSSIYLEVVLGYSALKAGFLLLPMTLSILVTLNLGSIVYNRVGAKLPTTVGMGLLTCGLIAIATTTIADGYTGMLLPFIVMGLGVGLFASPITAAALAAASHDDAGRAAGCSRRRR